RADAGWEGTRRDAVGLDHAGDEVPEQLRGVADAEHRARRAELAEHLRARRNGDGALRTEGAAAVDDADPLGTDVVAARAREAHAAQLELACHEDLGGRVKEEVGIAAHAEVAEVVVAATEDHAPGLDAAADGDRAVPVRLEPADLLRTDGDVAAQGPRAIAVREGDRIVAGLLDAPRTVERTAERRALTAGVQHDVVAEEVLAVGE